jgi:inosine-uridine nucleoside N-ribohydrolase
MHLRLLLSWVPMIAAFLNLSFGQTSPLATPIGQSPSRIPVILDTDIGDDIDDSWALVELLKSPQFDVKLITTTYGKPEYRARLIAKYLTIAGRTEIPVGLGPGNNSSAVEKMTPWIKDFPLSDYKVRIAQDGVQAIIDTINQSPEPVTVIGIGPMTTLAAAVRKDPGIATKANLVGMDGSIYKGYDGAATPCPEYNVYCDVADAKLVFSAPWKSITITPLDTCGIVRVGGALFQKLRESKDPLVQGLLESTLIHNGLTDPATLNNSGVCFDAVAVYLADPKNRGKFQMEKLKIGVENNGATTISPKGAEMAVATGWNDKDGFLQELVDLILSAPRN